ncbi:DivIVA domain-containing protein [Pseudonocardia nigra]|uniref:DivIVA domain-containing protein n=1 Tax=Pseudonocardia nigra TaxID=1921578 RepID=UPI001C6077CE|nr:DivIVA domain-containing protein [Pseudonocardia nigra]
MAGDPAAPPSDTGFEVVRRGYDQGQVDAHLRTLDAEIRILVADRDAAIDQSAQLTRELDNARVRAENLRAQVRSLVSPPQSAQGMSERMRSMLRLAEDEVAEMLSRTECEVSRRIRDAEQQAAQTVAAAKSEAAAIRAAAQADAERTTRELAQARAALDGEREAAEQERARVWVESEARRAQVEEDFAIAMDQRRAQALAALAEEQEAARRQADETRESAAAQGRSTVAEAEAAARAMLAEAERRVAELDAIRSRIAEQLGETHGVLGRSLTALALPPEQLNGFATRSVADARAVAASTGSNGSGAAYAATNGAKRPSPVVRNRKRQAAGEQSDAGPDGAGAAEDPPVGDAGPAAAPTSDRTGADGDTAPATANQDTADRGSASDSGSGGADPAGGNGDRKPTPRRRRRRSKAGTGRR